MDGFISGCMRIYCACHDDIHLAVPARWIYACRIFSYNPQCHPISYNYLNDISDISSELYYIIQSIKIYIFTQPISRSNNTKANYVSVNEKKKKIRVVILFKSTLPVHFYCDLEQWWGLQFPIMGLLKDEAPPTLTSGGGTGGPGGPVAPPLFRLGGMAPPLFWPSCSKVKKTAQ